MKKIVFLLSILSYLQSISQVSRIEFGEMIFNQLYSANSNPDAYDAAYYPNPFLDLSDNTDIGKKIKILSYLEYQSNAETPFYRNSNFYPAYDISRGEAIRAMVEAWDLPDVFYVTSPFNDVFPGDQFYGYLCSAYDYGMISGGTINPYSSIDNNEAQDYMTWVANSAFDPVSFSVLSNPDNYFIPNNYQPNNIGFLRGLEQGVFSHYAKNSFVIPDRKFNLNFSHYYSTQMVELPQSYFPVQPLGRGWTHTYNAYIVRENNVGSDEIDYYYIKWADGSIDVYNEDDNEYVTLGVYDDLDEQSSGDIIEITKKDQTKYYFEKLDNSELVFYLIQIVDLNGNEINIEYETSEVDNDFERIEWVEAPSGKRLNFYYHHNTDLIDYVEDPINRQIRFTYTDDLDRLRRFYDAKNQDTRYYYLAFDDDDPTEHEYKQYLLKRVRLPEGNSIRAEYDDDDNGKLESYQIDDNALTIIDVDYSDYEAITSTVSVPMTGTGNSQDFNYEFDAYSMVTHFDNDSQDIDITYPDPTDNNPLLPTNIDINGLDIDYEYDNRGNVLEINKENGDAVEYFTYSGENYLVTYTDANGNVTEFEYDNNGNLEYILDALGNQIDFTYDTYGQVLSITNQEGITVNYTYEDDGAVATITAPENLSSSFTYDGINRLITQIINGQTLSFAYDPNDNLTSQTNIGGLTTMFNYDENDNLVTITNANGVDTAFEYNDEDQVISETFNGLVKQYEYYDNGKLDRYIKPSGDEIDYDYTSDGKLNDAGTIADVDYYDEDAGKREGLISSLASDDIRYNFDYDNLNRLDEVEIDNDPNNTVSYNYDEVGNITRIYYPDSQSDFYVRYYYDAKNRLEEIRITANGSTQSVITYEYFNDDRLRKVWYPNDIEARYSYDNAGRLIRINHIKHFSNGGNNSLFIQEIDLDERGNILTDDSFYREQIENEEEQNFSVQDEAYAYNANNHITQVGDESVAVNDDGNTVQKGNIIYQYNVDDQLTSITGDNGQTNINFQLQYDAYGNRIEKDIIQGTSIPETRRYVWDIINNNVIKEYNPNGSEQRFYVYGASGLEFAVSPTTGSITRFYHGDIRGSVVFTSDYDDDVIANHFNKYDDFGNIVTNNNSEAEVFGNYKYLGKHGIVNDVTAQDGLYYIKARYYDAKLGRFLTQDPIWSTNLYPYSNNNPISRIDFNGKESSLVSIYDMPKEDPSNDTFFIGYTATVIPPMGFDNSGNVKPFTGFNMGVHQNFIIDGTNASSTPIPTVTYGENKGFDFGVTVDVGFCRDWVNSDFRESDLDSDETKGFSFGLGPTGFSYQRDTTTDGRVIRCYSLLLGADLGYSKNVNKTRRLFGN